MCLAFISSTNRLLASLLLAVSKSWFGFVGCEFAVQIASPTHLRGFFDKRKFAFPRSRNASFLCQVASALLLLFFLAFLLLCLLCFVSTAYGGYCCCSFFFLLIILSFLLRFLLIFFFLLFFAFFFSSSYISIFCLDALSLSCVSFAFVLLLSGCYVHCSSFTG